MTLAQTNTASVMKHPHPSWENYVAPFESLSGKNTEQVGSKAAKLAELLQSGFNVPNGFSITIEAFEEYCCFNHISINEHDTETISKKIRNGKFPPHLIQAINESLESLESLESNSNTLFAVRSSSKAEDGDTHSMAGQFDTFLNVSKKDVPQNIKDVWAGMFNDRVMAYTDHRLKASSLAMGIVVQRQIDALFAGVLFTLNPQTRSTDHLVIEWVEGLGEKLVSGEVTPERLFINRAAPTLPETLDTRLRNALQELVDEALKMESLYQQPLDIEFCVDTQGLWILQARPITALNSTSSTVWTNVNMNENFPHPLSPFTFSIVERFYTSYMSNTLRMFGWRQRDLYKARSIIENLTGIQGGRVYYNLNNWYEILHFFPVGEYLQKFLDNYIGQNIPFQFKSSELGQHFAKKARNPLRQIATYARLLLLHLRSQHHLNLFEQSFYKHKKQWRTKPYSELTLSELCNMTENIFSGFIDRYYYSQGIADIMVLIFPGSLKLLIKKWVPGNEENPDPLAARLLSGVKIKSTQPAEIMQQLANEILLSSDLQSLLEKGEYTQLENALPEELKKQFNIFMSQFGARCYYECMIVYPTFEERSDIFWELVKKYQHAPNKNNDQIESSTHKILNKNDHDNLKADILKKMPYWKRLIFSTLVKKAQGAIALREQGRIIRSLLFGEIRMITLAIGDKFKYLKYIEHREDIFFLSHTEIDNIINGKYPLVENTLDMINQRKSRLAHCETFEPPSFFLLERGQYYQHNEKKQDKQAVQNKKILVGVPVSAGIVRAKVRIILDPIEDNRLEPGEILLTRTTDPGWTPLFMIAGGLILERGGLLSHGAIVAREFSIPAIVGIENATQLLQDGEMVTLNADTGEVIRDT